MSAPGGHRRLLAAYPARLRRKHGTELVATLMEATGGRPTRSERGWLVLDGLRERFRPPARRPLAVVAAVLAMLVGGALGAALGSWAGTAGYPALPDAAALGQRILPGTAQSGSSDRYLFASAPVAAGTSIEQAADQVHRKLTADGWTAAPVTAGDASPGGLTDVHFAAHNAETRLDVYVYRYADGTEGIQLAGWPRRPASYLPLTIAGTLLGLVAGWLAGVALGHRIRVARRPRRSAVLAALGLLVVIPPATGFVASLARYLTVTDPAGTGELVHARGFAFGPTVDLLRALDLGSGWILSPSDLGLLPIWGFALIAVAAIIARPRRGDLAGEPGNPENSRIVA